MNFGTPIENIKYIGEKQSKKLKKIKIYTLGDLLFYFPEYYEDSSKISNIQDLKINENSVIKGKVIDIIYVDSVDMNNPDIKMEKILYLISLKRRNYSNKISIIYDKEGIYTKKEILEEVERRL